MKIKNLIIFLLLSTFTISSLAVIKVRSYKSDGVYVHPDYRGDPENTTYNNWSIKGNSNPNAEQKETRDVNSDESDW